jgi:hypothetical protein
LLFGFAGFSSIETILFPLSTQRHRIFVDHLLPESRALHLLVIKMLKSSGCGGLEITDVNNVYISRNELTYDVLQGWWTDAGTHASLAKANKLAHDLFLGDEFSKFKM